MFLFLFFKDKFKLLSLFSILLACTYVANATETVTFSFYYESGINDVGYVYNNFYDGSNIPITQVSKSDGQTSVSVTAKMDDEKSIANSFISNLNPTPNIHMVGLNTTDSEPDKLDFWIAGTLSINGETVSQEFYIARIPNHYWLGTLDGQTYTGSDGTNSQNDRGTQVYGSTTRQPYCLKEFGEEYYAVYVYTGYCSDTDQTQYDWSNAKTMKFDFEYIQGSEHLPSKVESMEFVYDGNNGDTYSGYDYLKSVSTGTYGKGYEVTVVSKIKSGTGTANSFIDKFSPTSPQNNMLEMDSINISTPSSLNFWIEGSLYINGTLLASDFTFGQETIWNGASKWWIASNNGKSFVDKDGVPKMLLDGYCFVVKNPLSDTYFSTNDDYTVWVYYVGNGKCPLVGKGGEPIIT